MPTTTSSALLEDLRDDIIRGTLAPGERLRLEELAERFGVSTMPIRQALRTLEAEGIVTVAPHKGAQVTQFGTAQILDLFEMRAVLEQLATTRAVPHLTAADFEALERVVLEMNDLYLAPQFDVPAFTRLNGQFHGLIYARSGRPLLVAQIRDRRVQVQHYLHRFTPLIHTGQLANEEHQLLLNLARSGRSELAGAAMYQHIMSAGEGIARLMQQEELTGRGQDREILVR